MRRDLEVIIPARLGIPVKLATRPPLRRLMWALACLRSGRTLKAQDLADQFEVSVRTAYGAAPNDLAMAMDLIATGRVAVTDMITHRLPLESAQEGFALVANAGESVKVVLEP